MQNRGFDILSCFSVDLLFLDATNQPVIVIVLVEVVPDDENPKRDPCRTTSAPPMDEALLEPRASETYFFQPIGDDQVRVFCAACIVRSIDRFVASSMICMMVLTLLLVFLINEVLERVLQYLTESTTPPESSPLQIFQELLHHLHYWTISWFYPL